MEEIEDEKAEDTEGVEADDAISTAAGDLTTTVQVSEQGPIKPPSYDSIQPLNVYQIKPPLHEKFKAAPVKEAIRSVLDETLRGKVYSVGDAKQWTIDIANVICEKVKELEMKRYKHITQVIIGEMKGAGVKCGLRCLWDCETDAYTSEVFINDTIFCVVIVFGVYLY